MATHSAETGRFSVPPGNLQFVYRVEEYASCGANVLSRADLEASQHVRGYALPLCGRVCAEGCVGDTCRCDAAARTAEDNALCASIEDCWAACTQLSLDSPFTCDGVDYSFETGQCFLTRECAAREPAELTHHWVKQNGRACGEPADFSPRPVGRAYVTQRAVVGQEYLLQPATEQVLHLSGSFTASDRVRLVSGVGVCGISASVAQPAFAAVRAEGADFAVTLARGQYKVCFCDHALVQECDSDLGYVIEVGQAVVSSLSCLAGTPTFVRAKCTEAGGGLRCTQ